MSCTIVSVAEWDALHSDYKLERPDGSRWAMLGENTGLEVVTVLDTVDLAILNRRIEAYTASAGPAEGDWVEFADSVARRVSFVTPLSWLPECDSVQTSDGGSWYFGEGYASFSGSLFPGVRRGTLTDTGEWRNGSCWFFHHDHAMAHNGVDVEAPFRVYRCFEAVPR